jgi:hypothetical protein
VFIFYGGTLSPHSRFKFLKKTYSAKALIGAPYGSVFEVQGTQIKRVESRMSSEMALDTLIGPEDELKAGPSVEETVDGAQVLDGDSISAMRASGASGQEIIAALVENSATFKDKTEFAKQKYLKKKAIKCGSASVLPVRIDVVECDARGMAPDTCSVCGCSKDAHATSSRRFFCEAR